MPAKEAFRLHRSKIAVIHVAKSQLGMAEEDYRALLKRIAGVESSRDLDSGAFEAVMAEFERLGFRSTHGRAQETRRAGMATPAQIGKIRGLWKEYTGKDNERSLGRWMEKRFHASHVRFLEDWRAGKAIAILLDMIEKKRAKAEREQAAVAASPVSDQARTEQR